MNAILPLKHSNFIALLIAFLSMAKSISGFKKTGETWESQPEIIFSMENKAPSLTEEQTCEEIKSALHVWDGIQVSKTHKFRRGLKNLKKVT